MGAFSDALRPDCFQCDSYDHLTEKNIQRRSML